MKNRNGQKGVSLTELAVVVAIIGLLLAAVVGGTNLLTAAKSKKLLSEIEHTKLAIDKFEEKYSYFPGDYHDATTMLGALHDGDGDTTVEADPSSTTGTPQEDLAVWEHLALAEYIRGSYSGEDATGARYEIGTNAYNSEAFPTGIFSFYREPSIRFYGHYAKEYLIFSSIINISGTGDGLPFGGIVTSRDAFAIDEKIDDGNAAKGRILTIRANTASASGCVTGAYSDTASNYILNDSTPSCRIAYMYNSF